MSLDFNVKNIKEERLTTTHPADLGKPKDQQRWSPVTEAMVWRTMIIGMDKITEKNVDEFYYRLRIIQLFDGPELSGPGDLRTFLTKADVSDHIGLKTNSDRWTRKQFFKAMSDAKPGLFRLTTQTDSARQILWHANGAIDNR